MPTKQKKTLKTRIAKLEADIAKLKTECTINNNADTLKELKAKEGKLNRLKNLSKQFQNKKKLRKQAVDNGNVLLGDIAQKGKPSNAK